ncbi:hypothetical protein B0F90DRAFT_1815582 [Multifurca ochricompacta]|uniref:Uncharacterized protein n=1 Tax=Multifurca ochricompacta TaxID=376703 RepID=A0AAD4QQH1_9AGAM|nr:hypothetical protein B0F90DRAFT_1815582 [Multifurca ochricompacta]
MSDYEVWLSGFLQEVTTDVYFFCPPHIAPLIKRLRGQLPLTLNTSFSTPFDVPPLRGLEKQYEEIHALDPEKELHGPELYAVWNAKAFFLDEGLRNGGARLKQAYDYGFWNDAGSLREARPYRAWPDAGRVADVFAEASLETGSAERT